jgi:hypothetical protein
MMPPWKTSAEIGWRIFCLVELAKINAPMSEPLKTAMSTAKPAMKSKHQRILVNKEMAFRAVSSHSLKDLPPLLWGVLFTYNHRLFK